ncbi:MAG: class I SAM-dependent methyltransferase [Pseudomonadota bacterium]
MSPEGGASGFNDHFSSVAEGYARYRPTYPDALFDWLASLCQRRDAAWDCATGSGQAASALAEYFDTVFATDASREQIEAAKPQERVRYSVARAEATAFKDSSFDLVTVGQALHWFDVDAFFSEAARVTAPGGVLAAWCYQVCRVSPEVDAAVDRLYTQLTGPFWPPERAFIERGYRDFTLPGAELNGPPLAMRLDWRADDMLGYLRTWSACHRYELEHGDDPVKIVEPDIMDAWGDAVRTVVWPLTTRVCRFPD